MTQFRFNKNIFICICIMLIAPSICFGATKEASSPSSTNFIPFIKPAPIIRGSVQSYLLLSKKTQLKRIEPGTYSSTSITSLPFYEIMNIRADNLASGTLSVQLQTIAGLDLGNLYLDNRFVADPTYGFVTFRTSRFKASLGRQFIYSAPNHLQLDGLVLSYQTPIHLGIEAYGGFLVSPKQGPNWYDNETATRSSDYARGFTNWQRKGDFAIGGKLFYRVGSKTDIGLSYLHTTQNEYTATQVLGFTSSLAPVFWLSLVSDINLDLMRMELRDALLYTNFVAHKNVHFTLHFKHVNPTSYIPATSIFSVFSNETYNSTGAEVTFLIGASTSIKVGYSQLFYLFYSPNDDNEYERTRQNGHDILGEFKYRYGKTKQGMWMVSINRHSREAIGINQFSNRLLIPIGKTGIKGTVNTYVDIYDEKIKARQYGLIGEFGLFFHNARHRTGFNVSTSYTPYFDTAFEAMATYSYNFNTRIMRRLAP